MTATAEHTGAWLEEFSKLREHEPWLKELHERAFARFAELGFPSTHDEEWRFTNVAPIVRSGFRAGGSARKVSSPSGLTSWCYPSEQGALAEAQAHLARYASY